MKTRYTDSWTDGMKVRLMVRQTAEWREWETGGQTGNYRSWTALGSYLSWISQPLLVMNSTRPLLVPTHYWQFCVAQIECCWVAVIAQFCSWPVISQCSSGPPMAQCCLVQLMAECCAGPVMGQHCSYQWLKTDKDLADWLTDGQTDDTDRQTDRQCDRQIDSQNKWCHLIPWPSEHSPMQRNHHSLCFSWKAMTKNAFSRNGRKHNVPVNSIRTDR